MMEVFTGAGSEHQNESALDLKQERRLFLKNEQLGKGYPNVQIGKGIPKLSSLGITSLGRGSPK